MDPNQPDQYTEEMLNRVERLLQQLASEQDSPAEAGLVLCAALQGLIVLADGRTSDTMNLAQLNRKFMALRKQELKGGDRRNGMN